MNITGEPKGVTMQSRRRGILTTLPNLALVLLIGLVLVACGASQAESEAPESEAPDTSQPMESEPAPSDEPSEEPASTAPKPASQAPVGEAGSFSVNGTEFAVTLLNRCIPFSDEPGNLDLQALAQGAQLNLYVLGSEVEVSVQGSAIQNEFGSIAFGEDPVVTESSVTDDRWTGSATVGDSLGSGETVDLVWDVQIPSEINDCSL